MAIYLNSAGLVLDICGALLLCWFGLPPSFNPEGKSFLMLEAPDRDAIQKGLTYRRLSRLGIWLVIAGFALQLISNFVN